MIEVLDKKDCCGCTACESICGVKAITMTADNEGFLYPKVNKANCTDCGLCERVCPISFRDKSTEAKLPINVYALHNNNEEIWNTSSSGGVFMALAEYCLAKNGIVYGAVYDDNFVVVHHGETTVYGVERFKGSKYVQSDLRGVFKEVRTNLNKGREVLFSGVPCQVEGLKLFLNKDYPNLTTVDILCHGVPSPGLFADYICYIRRHSPLPLKKVFMKDKTFGWGYQNLRIYYKGGVTEFNSSISNLWNKIFYDHIANRPSCHKCRFKNLNRTGDISIGDFWGIEKSHPEFHSEKGVSLLLVNSSHGMNVFKSINRNFDYLKSNLKECIQPVLDHSTPEPPERETFWEEYNKYGFDKTIRKKYGIKKSSNIARNLKSIMQFVKNATIQLCHLADTQ